MDIFGVLGAEGLGGGIFSPEHTVPEINGFDQFSELSNQDVEALVNDLLPNDHLKNCGEITCDPNDPYWNEVPGAAGYHVEYLDGSPSNICLAGKGALEGTGTSELEVLCHEIGHNAYNNLSLMETLTWSEIHANLLALFDATGFGFVSSYAHTNLFEDFAETYAVYVTNPDFLQFISPEKYNFMHDHVFDGREYDQIDNHDGTATLVARDVGQSLAQAAVVSEFKTGEEAVTSAGNAEISPGDIYRCFSMIS